MTSTATPGRDLPSVQPQAVDLRAGLRMAGVLSTGTEGHLTCMRKLQMVLGAKQLCRRMAQFPIRGRRTESTSCTEPIIGKRDETCGFCRYPVIESRFPFFRRSLMKSLPKFLLMDIG
jgi:hypothetical protein